jgi:hypothetical protein
VSKSNHVISGLHDILNNVDSTKNAGILVICKLGCRENDVKLLG